MRVLTLNVFKRCLKLTVIGDIGEKLYKMDVSVGRHKARVAALKEDKLIEFETVSADVHNFCWLHKVAPGFPVDGSKITIIHEPADFYSILLDKCKSAQKRITFASLYLGTGKLEQELVKTIEDAIYSSGGNIKVRFLLDYMRGSRGIQNSRRMLEPLLKGTYANSSEVYLYHTPRLRGLLKAVMPNRFNELIGLQHMKLYIVDDMLIISGANLSNDYFTNRQDRYFLIEDSKELCDFYDSLVKQVGEFSFVLQPDGTTVLNTTVNSHPCKGSKQKFLKEAASRIQTFLRDEISKRKQLNQKTLESFTADTWIFPLIQMGQLNIKHDSEVTLKLLQTAPLGGGLKLATGYFNLTKEYSNALLKQCQATCDLLTAHPTANGFFAANGIAKGIPAAYTKIEDSFYKMCEKLRQQKRITLWEFIKPGWTYHAKGLWYYLPNQQKPCLTLVGSPNFGYRSVRRDLETQIAILTKNDQLQTALQKEQEKLFSYAHLVTRKTFSQEDRIPPAWVRTTVTLFRYFF